MHKKNGAYAPFFYAVVDVLNDPVPLATIIVGEYNAVQYAYPSDDDV